MQAALRGISWKAPGSEAESLEIETTPEQEDMIARHLAKTQERLLKERKNG